MNPSEDRTKGNSRSRWKIYFGVEKGCMERRRCWRRRDQCDGRRTCSRAAENLLVGHVHEKVMMMEKIRPEDWNIDRR